jgi:hypothetical protein
MNREELYAAIKNMRAQWRSVRSARLGRREFLAHGGIDTAALKKDMEYRRLDKQQSRLTTALKHMEKKLNRMRARDGEKDR